MNRAAFFDKIREPLFGGSLRPVQVEHIEAILDAATAARWPLAYVAYGLATAYHETAQFVHLHEKGGPAYFKRMYDITGDRPKAALRNGNINPGDGAKFFGRGYVHLTWRANYRRAGQKIGIDLERDPEAAALPSNAARIMIEGMQEGWFTGMTCRHFLDRAEPNYIGARSIINGTDRASMIAGYARAFERALIAAGHGVAPQARPAPPAPSPAPKPERPSVKPAGPATAIPAPSKVGWLARFFGRA